MQCKSASGFRKVSFEPAGFPKPREGQALIQGLCTVSFLTVTREVPDVLIHGLGSRTLRLTELKHLAFGHSAGSGRLRSMSADFSISLFSFINVMDIMDAKSISEEKFILII